MPNQHIWSIECHGFCMDEKKFRNLKTYKVTLWSDHGLYKPNVLFTMAEQDVVEEYEYSLWH